MTWQFASGLAAALVAFGADAASAATCQNVDAERCAELADILAPQQLRDVDRIIGQILSSKPAAGTAEAAPETPAPASSEGDHLWTNEVETDPMTDQQNSYWTLLGTERMRDGFGGLGNYPAILARCYRGRTEVAVGWDEFITGEEDKISVRYRFDDIDPVIDQWYISSNNQAAFAPAPEWLLQWLAQSDRFIIEASDRGGSILRAQFRVGDVARVVNDIAQRCDWKAQGFNWTPPADEVPTEQAPADRPPE